MHTDVKALGEAKTPTTEIWNWIKKTFTPSYQDEISKHFDNCQTHAEVEYVTYALKNRGIL